MPDHPTHGGARPGSGRKPGPEKRAIMVRLPPRLVERLDRVRGTTGESRSALIEEAVIAWLGGVKA